MTDRERALELLERNITDGRDADADPAVTARECLVALEGLGYRLTAARAAADWRMHGTGAGPSAATRAALEAAREACAVSPTRVHADDSQLGETA